MTPKIVASITVGPAYLSPFQLDVLRTVPSQEGAEPWLGSFSSILRRQGWGTPCSVPFEQGEGGYG